MKYLLALIFLIGIRKLILLLPYFRKRARAREFQRIRAKEDLESH